MIQESFIKALEGLSGMACVSVYIPPSYPMDEAREQIKSELETAMNITDDGVRVSVKSSLSMMLALFPQANCDNGVALFSSGTKFFAIVPEDELTSRLFWCGQKFILDPLRKYD